MSTGSMISSTFMLPAGPYTAVDSWSRWAISVRRLARRSGGSAESSSAYTTLAPASGSMKPISAPAHAYSRSPPTSLPPML